MFPNERKIVKRKVDEKTDGYQLREYGILVHKRNMYIPNCTELKKIIIYEIH